MLRASIIAAITILALVPFTARSEDDPKTLLTRIAEWQYPDSKMSGATMSDAPTVDEKGDRTVSSIHCKTVLTTSDPIDKVFEYYKSKLAQNGEPKVQEPDKQTDTAVASPRTSGRSVTFHSDSEGRPVAIHVISINSDQMSTTLVISRAQGESETHIAWSQYEQFGPKQKQAD